MLCFAQADPEKGLAVLGLRFGKRVSSAYGTT